MDQTEGTEQPGPAPDDATPAGPPPPVTGASAPAGSPAWGWPATPPPPAPGSWPRPPGAVTDWSPHAGWLNSPPPPPTGWGSGSGDPYWAPQPPRRGSVSVAVTALLVLVAALAGIGIGRSMPASSSGSLGASGGYTPPGNSGVSGSGGSGASGASGSSTTTPAANRQSTGAGGPTDARAIAAKVDPALVDINTDISYDGDEAAGTGIVLNPSGLILTNNHVINGASSISVTDIGNRRTYAARVVGYDEVSDVAIIQLKNASGLKTAVLGNSTRARVGLPVVALGNAGGRGGAPSIAPGSITALDQSIQASDEGNGTTEQLSGLIQTNANVQPGDSGGSLVDTAAQVIGIDTAAAQNATAVNPAQGFAIPINSALGIGRRIESRKGSDVIHIGATAFLGVEYRPSQKAVAKVVGGTAAQRAGIAAGDVITSFAGHQVTSPSALTKLLVQYHPGDQVTITWTTASDDAGKATVTLGAGPAA